MAVLHRNPRLSPVLPGPQSEQETTCRKNSSPDTLDGAQPVFQPTLCHFSRATRLGPRYNNHDHNISHDFLFTWGEAAWPMDGYQLAALHVLVDTALLVHMLCTGAVQFLRQAKAQSTCPESLWETFGVWVFVCIVCWVCLLSNLVGQSSAQIKIIRQQIKMVVITLTYYQW